MKKDLIVAIFVPTQRGSGTSKDRQPGLIGTGYPVAEDLVLTARHVLNPPLRNHRAKIRLCWFFSRYGCEKHCWQTVDKADLVWEGSGDLDAALIRCPIPQALRDYAHCTLSETPPHSGSKWESAGFARADTRNGIREPGDFGGKVCRMADNQPFFTLIEDAQPEREEDWRGASGMPVFVDGVIVGVVKQVSPKYSGKKLEAVPSFLLLNNKKFRELLGLDEARERRRRAMEYLLSLLERGVDLTQELALALQCSGEAMTVVDRLINQTPPLESLFAFLLDIQFRLRAAEKNSDARLARDLVLAILPALWDASVVGRVRRERAMVEIPIVALPTKLTTLAEIIMAAADKRPADCRKSVTDLQWPEGCYHIPEPPEAGRDSDNQYFTRDWRDMLIQGFARDDGRFADLFRNYLKEKFIPQDLRSAAFFDAERELLDTVAYELKRKSEDKRQPVTFYYIVPFNQGDADVRQKREADIAGLKKDFPHLVFLRLAGEMPLKAEYERYGKLRSILYDAPEKEREIS
ncbi:serine protease [Marichromatium sp. AB31]|uniref:serine protease n=1 Tax=Marichromatium sp. AB31 TaxID=2483362 RepID=UPI0011CE2D4F|nr:serine protease [Marichromatium sp. AB31]